MPSKKDVKKKKRHRKRAIKKYFHKEHIRNIKKRFSTKKLPKEKATEIKTEMKKTKKEHLMRRLPIIAQKLMAGKQASAPGPLPPQSMEPFMERIKGFMQSNNQRPQMSGQIPVHTQPSAMAILDPDEERQYNHKARERLHMDREKEEHERMLRLSRGPPRYLHRDDLTLHPRLFREAATYDPTKLRGHPLYEPIQGPELPDRFGHIGTNMPHNYAGREFVKAPNGRQFYEGLDGTIYMGSAEYIGKVPALYTIEEETDSIPNPNPKRPSSGPYNMDLNMTKERLEKLQERINRINGLIDEIKERQPSYPKEYLNIKDYSHNYAKSKERLTQQEQWMINYLDETLANAGQAMNTSNVPSPIPLAGEPSVSGVITRRTPTPDITMQHSTYRKTGQLGPQPIPAPRQLPKSSSFMFSGVSAGQLNTALNQVLEGLTEISIKPSVVRAMELDPDQTVAKEIPIPPDISLTIFPGANRLNNKKQSKTQDTANKRRQLDLDRLEILSKYEDADLLELSRTFEAVRQAIPKTAAEQEGQQWWLKELASLIEYRNKVNTLTVPELHKLYNHLENMVPQNADDVRIKNWWLHQVYEHIQNKQAPPVQLTNHLQQKAQPSQNKTIQGSVAPTLQLSQPPVDTASMPPSQLIQPPTVATTSSLTDLNTAAAKVTDILASMIKVPQTVKPSEPQRKTPPVQTPDLNTAVTDILASMKVPQTVEPIQRKTPPVQTQTTNEVEVQPRKTTPQQTTVQRPSPTVATTIKTPQPQIDLSSRIEIPVSSYLNNDLTPKSAFTDLTNKQLDFEETMNKVGSYLQGQPKKDDRNIKNPLVNTFPATVEKAKELIEQLAPAAPQQSAPITFAPVFSSPAAPPSYTHVFPPATTTVTNSVPSSVPSPNTIAKILQQPVVQLGGVNQVTPSVQVQNSYRFETPKSKTPVQAVSVQTPQTQRTTPVPRSQSVVPSDVNQQPIDLSRHSTIPFALAVPLVDVDMKRIKSQSINPYPDRESQYKQPTVKHDKEAEKEVIKQNRDKLNQQILNQRRNLGVINDSPPPPQPLYPINNVVNDLNNYASTSFEPIANVILTTEDTRNALGPRNDITGVTSPTITKAKHQIRKSTENVGIIQQAAKQLGYTGSALWKAFSSARTEPVDKNTIKTLRESAPVVDLSLDLAPEEEIDVGGPEDNNIIPFTNIQYPTVGTAQKTINKYKNRAIKNLTHDQQKNYERALQKEERDIQRRDEEFQAAIKQQYKEMKRRAVIEDIIGSVNFDHDSPVDIGFLEEDNYVSAAEDADQEVANHLANRSEVYSPRYHLTEGPPDNKYHRDENLPGEGKKHIANFVKLDTVRHELEKENNNIINRNRMIHTLKHESNYHTKLLPILKLVEHNSAHHNILNKIKNDLQNISLSNEASTKSFFIDNQLINGIQQINWDDNIPNSLPATKNNLLLLPDIIEEKTAMGKRHFECKTATPYIHVLSQLKNLLNPNDLYPNKYEHHYITDDDEINFLNKIGLGTQGYREFRPLNDKHHMTHTLHNIDHNIGQKFKYLMHKSVAGKGIDSYSANKFRQLASVNENTDIIPYLDNLVKNLQSHASLHVHPETDLLIAKVHNPLSRKQHTTINSNASFKHLPSLLRKDIVAEDVVLDQILQGARNQHPLFTQYTDFPTAGVVNYYNANPER